MKKYRYLCLFLCVIIFAGCAAGMQEPTVAEPLTTETMEPPAVIPETTVPSTTEATEPQPLHSPLYIPGTAVEDVIFWFNEVCLDAEFINSGDPSVLQKWEETIVYTLYGSYNNEDLAVLCEFAAWLNGLEGFPGIREAEEGEYSNLRIHFCSGQQMVEILGDNFWGMDGGVTFWYLEDAIYDETICVREDLSRALRTSVLLEELYNGLGPVQDTVSRPDSIIYSEYAEPQNLTEVDRLLLKLLYHPEMDCGMTADECETVIRSLYY